MGLKDYFNTVLEGNKLIVVQIKNNDYLRIKSSLLKSLQSIDDIEINENFHYDVYLVGFKYFEKFKNFKSNVTITL